MTQKLMIFCLILTLAIPGWCIASGPDVGGGFDSGPGLSGSRERNEAEGYPSGSVDGGHPQGITILPPPQPSQNIPPATEVYPGPQREPAVPGGIPDQGSR